MEQLLTAVAVFAGLFLMRIVEPLIYKYNNRAEAVDHFVQNRWNIPQHTDLQRLRDDFRFDLERTQTALDKLNEAVFLDQKPKCQLDNVSNPLSTNTAVPRSL